MKRVIVCIAACLLTELTSSSASAQFPHMLNVMRMIPLSRSLDTNNDGEISACNILEHEV